MSQFSVGREDDFLFCAQKDGNCFRNLISPEGVVVKWKLWSLLENYNTRDYNGSYSKESRIFA